jgi:hypothetical protein
MTEQIDSLTNEHVLEVRYRPNPKVLGQEGKSAV